MNPKQTSTTLAEPTGEWAPNVVYWAVFVAGWTLFGLLSMIMKTVQGEAPLAAIGTTVLGVAPAAVLAALIVRRREWFAPARSLFQAIKLHLVIGLAYAVTIALIFETVYLWRTPSGLEEWPHSYGAMLALLTFEILVLYSIIAVFTMWFEASEQFRETQVRIARESVLRAQAELKALRAQFNPHFVFNTLHSMILLIRADPEAAERTIEDVAGLIRYASTLQRLDLDVVPLAQELEFSRRYLALERLRLGDRLTVTWDTDEEADGVAIPAFSVQTLIENAIKHAASTRVSPTNIVIRTALEDDKLVLQITDDGPGADGADITLSGSHGLALLGQRVASLYDDNGQLTWKTAPGEGFSVTLRIPQQSPPDEIDPALAAALLGDGRPTILAAYQGVPE